MSSFSRYDKPSWVPTDDLSQVTATSKGWVYTRDDGTSEVICAIKDLDSKQIPRVVHITTDRSVYTLDTHASITFNVLYDAPITATSLTSATKLVFSLDSGDTELEADFSSIAVSGALVFVYTFVGTELAQAGTSDAILVTEIALDGSETIVLNYEGYTGDDEIEAEVEFSYTTNSYVVKSITPTPCPTPSISSYPRVTSTVTATATVTETVTATVTETVTVTVTQ